MKASRYAQKRLRNGADSYGSWNNGVQTRAEKVNGHTLTYDHVKSEWR